MKLGTFLVATLVVALPCLAESGPDTLWTRTYRLGDEDWAQVILPLSDGSFLLAGNTISYAAGKSDFLLMKVDAQGKSLWSHAYGREDEDILSGATLTSDGGVLMAGFTLSFNKEQPTDTIWTPFLVCTNDQGDTVWTRHYPTPGGGTAFDAIALKDGDFMVAGRIRGEPNGLDVYLMKIDRTGNVRWSKSYGGKNWDEAEAVRETPDGGFALAGRTYSQGAGKFDAYVIRTDRQGDTLWTRTFGNDGDERIFDLRVTADGGFVIAGTTESEHHPNESAYVVRLNSAGQFVWKSSFTNEHGGGVRAILELPKGGFVITGYTGAAARPEADIYLARLDASGKLVWERTYGGAKWDLAESVALTADGGYAIAGATKSYHDTGTDFLLVRTRPE